MSTHLTEQEAEYLFQKIKRPMPRTPEQIDRIALKAVRKALRLNRRRMRDDRPMSY